MAESLKEAATAATAQIITAWLGKSDNTAPEEILALADDLMSRFQGIAPAETDRKRHPEYPEGFEELSEDRERVAYRINTGKSAREWAELLAEEERQAKEEPRQQLPPAHTTIEKSLADPEKIISFIDGKSYKTLARHLSSKGITQEEYREAYDLPEDYPFIAPAYRDRRSQIAKDAGLGKSGRKPKKS